MRALAALLSLLLGACEPAGDGRDDYGAGGKADDGAKLEPCADCKVIVMVWDGFRPDAITETGTPNLWRLAQGGVTFADHHSTYPTFTMVNAGSLATGQLPGATGFYGNRFWQPGPTGRESDGRPVDFQQPVFTEDYAVLEALDRYYQNHLLLVGTLFEAAQDAGFTTAAVGKTGPAFLQDYHKGGVILDEKMAWPLDFARELQAEGVALPKTSPRAYPQGQLTLAAGNGDPTEAGRKVYLADGVTPDPTDRGGSPYARPSEYLVRTYLDHVLPGRDPDLTVLWIRNPDTTEHTYGVGPHNVLDAFAHQDALLGEVLARLEELGLSDRTDLLIVSDHGHSNVSGPLDLFPLRGVAGGEVGDVDPEGYSVSGYVRLAELLTRAGFAAYDGSGCQLDPVLAGILADGTRLATTRTDADGSACGGAPGKKYTTRSYKLPATLPPGAVVIAPNGGSDYLYVPDRDAETVRRLVTFLQGREEYGAIFVAKRHGALPGTLPLDRVRLENAAERNPDIIASFTWDDGAVVQGFPGIEYASSSNTRGMHGTFGPTDVHNTLVAFGPHFRKGLVDDLPTGNVDVAPTVARLLGVTLPDAYGRPLLEAMDGGAAMSEYTLSRRTVRPSAKAAGLTVIGPTGQARPGTHSYTIELRTQTVRRNGRSFTYFDWAKAVRP